MRRLAAGQKPLAPRLVATALVVVSLLACWGAVGAEPRTFSINYTTAQKRYGFTAENLRVTAKFNTSFTNHGMQIPQLLILKVSNDIQLEADLVLVLAQ
jgi:hypothetical protein